MKLISPVVAVTVVLVGALAGATALFMDSLQESADRPVVSEQLGQAVTAERIQLYKPGSEYVRASDFTALSSFSDRRPIRRLKSDGGTVDIYVRSDHTWEFSLEYFPAPVGQAKKLKAAVSYALDGTTKAAEIAFRDTGARLLRGLLSPDGNYVTTQYFDNGVDKSSMTEVGLGYNTYETTPTLLTETRWHENHKLAYTSVLNRDNSRTATTYDVNGEQIGVSTLTSSINGSSVVLYYDGGKQIRLRSTSGYWSTDVQMYRLDGTLERTLQISDGILEVFYYDVTGKKKLLKQSWFFTRQETNGIAHMVNIRLYEVSEMDVNGEESRSWYYTSAAIGDNPHHIWSFQEFHKAVDGHPQDVCKRIINLFREDDQTLKSTDCQGAPNVADFSVQHVAGEKLMPPAVPSVDMIFPQISDDLPIPRPQSGPGGR